MENSSQKAMQLHNNQQNGPLLSDIPNRRAKKTEPRWDRHCRQEKGSEVPAPGLHGVLC